MKKILITGVNSYVGKSLLNYLQTSGNYLIDLISLRNNFWRSNTFSEYDVVFHVSGIAHIKETKNNADLYYKVNRDLTFEVAKKAKDEGVKQFIFLSSMSVYGIERGIIDLDTPLKARSNYGKSKLQAEELIRPLEDDDFKIAILRAPMIYGKGCSGNYAKLSKLALMVPFFPNVDNFRSMIHIDNLCEFIRLLIEEGSGGLFFPQNREYVKTSEMVKLIAQAHGKNISLLSLLNFVALSKKSKIINKMFGNLVYKKEISNYQIEYNIVDFKESIIRTEL
jgi:nucleoside-diphosphate-sugar epimerase